MHACTREPHPKATHSHDMTHAYNTQVRVHVYTQARIYVYTQARVHAYTQASIYVYTQGIHTSMRSCVNTPV
jgi:hypothetical protein